MSALKCGLTAVAALLLGSASAQTPPATGGAAPTAPASGGDLQKQVNDIQGVLPKFAIPMREVGDRFQNMYYAAQGGNWGLAAYMSKYMNGAMTPARLTKPAEYKTWQSFYTGTWQPVESAIKAKDIKAFNKAYKDAIGGCNACHQAMGYGFVEVVQMKSPADEGINYRKASNPGDVPP